MRNTGEWTNYVTDSVAVTLNPGYDNTIRFETTGNDFGNLDEVTILPQPLTAIEPSDGTIPIRYKLFQNQPNPFNPATLIRYHLPHPGRVQLAVYNIIGQRIIYLVDEEQRAGEKMVRWDGMDQRGRPVGSGIYIYRLQVGDFVESKQMLLVR
ncbi:MAG TPA: T9SS type A sorting domain-containing protein [Calditrichia bacterium]|nr:T9SS type A sorting domain-containing protein [Calditrichia bacterium]